MTQRLQQRLGNYLLHRLIGVGSFADVYLGMHIYLNSRVAIKVLHTHVNALTWQSFLTEARHLSRLEHAHIIRVFDFSIEDEVPFLVMDYAAGGNLRQRHPAGALVPLPTALAYVTTIASALQYTHAQHLIHRDLKPENLLVGEHGQLLLSDFGLALLSASSAELQVPERFGTLAYMAPEQIQGQASAASDQYALAVMVYEWLCGRRPFEGTVEQLALQHLFAAPPAVRELHPEVPPAVEQAVLRALSKEPSRRFEDVLSFAAALAEACLPTAAALRLSPPSSGVVSAAEPVIRASSGSHPAVENLPVPLTPLVGRERELQLALARLVRPEVRLLTLLGSPGVGKTHLALALAGEVQPLFAQGVCFVSLAPISDPEQVVPSILHALQQPERKDRTPLAQLVAALREQQQLLLLDTFEQVLPAAPLLSELLCACPQLTILVTSRAALHVQGEYELTVPPLAVPEPGTPPSPETLAKVPAVTLFVERAEALKPGFALSERNAALIAELCVWLGGVPLAIELAAARCKLLSLEALRARLQQGLAVLSGGNQNRPSRQQSLRNTIAWSYELLSAQEQWLLRRLCVFAGEFTLQAAEAVASPPAGRCGLAALDGIISLLDKSLLQRRPGEEPEPRLYLLAIVRAFGREQLAQRGELQDCQQTHAAYYLALAGQAQGAARGAEQLGWLRQVELEYENIRAAQQWFLEHHEHAAALRLPSALREFWGLRGRLSEGRAVLAQALEAAGQDDTPAVGRLRAQALAVAGELALRQNDLAAAARELTASLELSRRLKQAGGMALCLARLGYIHAVRGEGAQGQASQAESLALVRDIGERGSRAEVWQALGSWALQQGRGSEARQQLEHSLALYEAEDDVWGKARTLHLLGVSCLAQQDYARARQCSEESLALMRRMGNPSGTSDVLAEAALARGYAAWAVQLCSAAESLQATDGYDSPLGREQASSDRTLAEAHLHLGEKAYAAAWAEGQALRPQQVVAARAAPATLEEVRPRARASRQSVATVELPGGLTAREVEVLRLLGQGSRNQQIAEHLNLSPYTVNSHTQAIYGKLGINSRSAATRFAVDHHLL